MQKSQRTIGMLGVISALGALAPTVFAQTPAVEPSPSSSVPAADGTPAATDGTTTAVPDAPAPVTEPVVLAPVPVVAAPVVVPVVTASAEVEAAPKLPVAGYDKSFFVQSEDGKSRLEVGGRVQPRFTYEAIKGAKNKAYFTDNRAEVRLSGNLFEKELTYKFEADFGKGSVALKDFFVDYAFIPNVLHVRVGQFKKPFSRTGIASSGNLETNERALSDKAFGSGRDQGIMLSNNYEKSPTIEWALGLFNGTGETPWFAGGVTGKATGTADDDGAVTGTVTGTVDKSSKFTIIPTTYHPMLVARLGYNYGELKGYSEADLEGGALRFGVAASGLVDMDTDGGNDSLVRAEIDGVLKVEGLSLTGGYYVGSKQTGAGFSNRGFELGAYHAQLGYVIAGKVQPLVRISQVVPKGPKNNESEFLGGISFYPYKHAFKWQNNFVALHHEKSDLTDYQFQSQVQLSF